MAEFETYQKPHPASHHKQGETGRTSSPALVHTVLRSPGQPLEAAARAFLEPRFGRDFSQVRIHTGPDAAQAAGSVAARAFTVGPHIVFNHGRFAPGSQEGRKLLAHELTHVVQQGASGPALQRASDEDLEKKPAQAPAPAAPAPAAKEEVKTAPAAPASDAAIDALDLEATAKAGAQEIKKKHPEISFTSGRRDIAGQAHAMAVNVVGSDRKWIEKTYLSAAKLQKWVDDHPDAKTVEAIADGLEETMNAMSAAEVGKISKHLTGEAFDIQPQEKDADAIKKDIQGLTGLSKFLEKEGGLTRWHAQFQLEDPAKAKNDPKERQAEQTAAEVVNEPAPAAKAAPPAAAQAAPPGKSAQPAPPAKKVCLTFDDGPEKGTEDVLNALGSSIPATFFLTGKNMAGDLTEQKRLVERMLNEGHQIGNHTYTHDPMTLKGYESAYGDLSDPARLKKFQDNYTQNESHFQKLLGKAGPVLPIARLPGDGRLVKAKGKLILVQATQGMGMAHVSWNFELGTNGSFSTLKALDWQGVKGVASELDRLPSNNDIVLLHDRHWAGKGSLLTDALNKLKQNNFTFGKLGPAGECQ